MISLWLAISCLLLLAAVFFGWPLLRYRKTLQQKNALSDDELNQRLAENVRLFREHLTELEKNLANESITQEEFNQLKLELERNLLDDESSLRATKQASVINLGVKTVVAFSLALFVFAVVFYQKYGAAPDVKIQALQQEKMQQDYQDMLQNHEPDKARAQKLIDEYSARLKAKPDSVEYWFLLARAQMEQGNYSQAVDAYKEVLSRDAQSPMIMAEMAQAIFLSDGGNTSQPVMILVKKALALDPKNTMALGLAGIDAFKSKNYIEAIRYWQKTVDLLGDESQGKQDLLGGIEKAKKLFVEAGGKLEEITAKSPYSIQVWVSLGEKAKASADQIVFVYARAWQGSPMPLAIMRFKASELPKLVQLDETMAMSPAASLATATEVEVVARVSTDGSAQTKAGDWQAKQGPISMKAIPGKLELKINEQVADLSGK